MRYALIAYVASWIGVAVASLGAFLLFGVNLGAAGALWFDLAWLLSLIPLRRAGTLRAADLGLRATPALRAIGLTLLVFVASALFDGYWRSRLGLGPVTSPFSGIAAKSTAIIVLTGIAAVVSPVVEEVFFRGLLYRCFRNRFSVLPSSVAVGVMFGLVHMEYPLAVLPELAVYGSLLCLLYEHTGSLWPGITLNLYADAGGFEQALTGRYTIVFLSVVLLVLVLVVRGLRGRSGGKFPPPPSAFAT